MWEAREVPTEPAKSKYDVYGKHYRKLYQVGCSRATVQRAKKRMETDHHALRITHHRTTQHISHNP